MKDLAARTAMMQVVFEILGQMLFELGVAATPAKVALAVGAVALVALAAVLVIVLI